MAPRRYPMMGRSRGSRYTIIAALLAQLFAGGLIVHATPTANAGDDPFCPDAAVCAWTGRFGGRWVQFGPVRSGLCTRVSYSNDEKFLSIQNNTNWPAHVHRSVDCTGDYELIPKQSGRVTAGAFRSVWV
ncbi:peptidase inhibitor family I36 protein [Nocardia colli]|uniref:peptidase inhibitor family I36 protein n=1 Tax=Nocardia colli TaxID=2545717 RepID=UPI0035DB68B6